LGRVRGRRACAVLRGPRCSNAPGLPGRSLLRLRVEAGIALKIALATGEFWPGRYTCTDACRNNWTLD
jgi:hypothetical protein